MKNSYFKISNIIFRCFLVCTTLFLSNIYFTQSWKDYSDSSYKYLYVDLNKSENFIELATDLVSKVNPLKTLDYINYQYRSGVVFLFKNNNKKAELTLKNAKSNFEKYFSEINNSLLIIRINYYLAYSQKEQNKHKKSIESFKTAKNKLIIFNEKKDINPSDSKISNLLLLYTYENLSKIYSNKLKAYDSSAKYYFKAAKCLAKTSSIDTSRFINNIERSAWDYCEIGDFKKAKKVLDFSDSLIVDKKNINYASILNGFEWFYRKQDNYEKAIIYIKKKLNIYLDNYNNNKKNIVDTYASLALCYSFLDDHTNSAENYINAIELGLKVEEVTKKDISGYYSRLSGCYDSHALNDNVKANYFLNLSNQYKESNNDIKDGDYYYDQFDLSTRNEQYDKAKNYFFLAEEKYLEEKNFEWVFYLYFMGMDLALQGRIFKPEQIQFFNDKIKDIESNLDSSMSHLVVLAYAFNEHSKLNFKNVELLLEKNIDKFNESELDSYNFLLPRWFLAIAKSSLGKTDEALKLIDFCIDHTLKIDGENSSTLLLYYQKAALITSLDKPESIMKYITPASVIIASNNMNNSLIDADFKIIKGSALLNQKNKNGLELLISGINIYDNFKSYPNYMTLIEACNRVAVELGSQEDFNKANYYLNKSDSVLNQYNSSLSYFHAQQYYVRANLFFSQDKFKKANEYYLKSKNILDQFSVPNQSGINVFYGMSLWASNKDKELGKSLMSDVIKSKSFIPQIHLENAKLFLFKINLLEGNIELAKEYLTSLIDQKKESIEQIYKYLSDVEKKQYLMEAGMSFEWLNSQLLYDDINTKFLKQFMDYRSFYRSLLLSNSNKRFLSFFENNSNNNLKISLEKLKSNTLLINRMLESKDPNKDIITDLSKENEELERVLSYEFEKVGLKEPAINYESILNNLSKNESFVEIIRINKHAKNLSLDLTDSISYAAIVIEKEKDPYLITLDTLFRFEKGYSKFYSSYVKGGNKNKIDKLSYEFYLSKIINKVGADKTIYLSPDGIYNNINLLSLYNSEKESYVLELNDIRIVSGARGFILNKVNNLIDNYADNAVLVGNPKFNLEDSDFSTNEIVSSQRDFNISEFDSLSRNGIMPLPGTFKEVNAIKNLLVKNNWNVDLLEGVNASEKLLKDIKSPRILHISTHGFFLSKEQSLNHFSNLKSSNNSSNFLDNPLSRSGLLLSGAQNTILGKQKTFENGILTALEARELNLLNTELVVLSACETGLGEHVSGQGVYGLQRSMIEAGADNVIMSLWKVDDNATQILMNSFYKFWISDKMNVRDALKKAQINLMNTEKYFSPYYWGAFVLIGN